nr:aldehyde dehydrogenase family protein [Chloroflexia bacterium]
MTTEYPIYIGGAFVQTRTEITITNPFDGSSVGTTWLAGPDDLDRATRAAETAFRSFGKTAVFDRVDLLKALAAKLKKRRSDVIDIIVREAGKPVGEATTEIDRGVFTIETAAEEAKRIQGDVIPLDLLPSSKGRFGIVRRFPIGPIAGISPFNFPLNLALHKVAPAIASGNTIVLKPPTLAPLTMLFIAQLADEVGVPKGVLN